MYDVTWKLETPDRHFMTAFHCLLRDEEVSTPRSWSDCKEWAGRWRHREGRPGRQTAGLCPHSSFSLHGPLRLSPSSCLRCSSPPPHPPSSEALSNPALPGPFHLLPTPHCCHPQTDLSPTGSHWRSLQLGRTELRNSSSNNKEQ